MNTIIYTDGSIAVRRISTCAPVAGWAFVAVQRESVMDHRDGEVVGWSSGRVSVDPAELHFIGAERPTVNAAELSGVYWALSYLHKAKVQEAWIFSDSRYAISVSQGQYPAVKNKALVHSVRSALLGVAWTYRLRWVKAHVGHRFNEMADAFAKVAARNG